MVSCHSSRAQGERLDGLMPLTMGPGGGAGFVTVHLHFGIIHLMTLNVCLFHDYVFLPFTFFFIS